MLLANHGKHLLDAFAGFRDNFAAIEVIALGGARQTLNQNLLRILSPALRRILANVPQDCVPTLIVPDASGCIIRQLDNIFNFGFTTVNIISQDDVEEIMEAAKLFGVDLSRIAYVKNDNSEYAETRIDSIETVKVAHSVTDMIHTVKVEDPGDIKVNIESTFKPVSIMNGQIIANDSPGSFHQTYVSNANVRPASGVHMSASSRIIEHELTDVFSQKNIVQPLPVPVPAMLPISHNNFMSRPSFQPQVGIYQYPRHTNQQANDQRALITCRKCKGFKTVDVEQMKMHMDVCSRLKMKIDKQSVSSKKKLTKKCPNCKVYRTENKEFLTIHKGICMNPKAKGLDCKFCQFVARDYIKYHSHMRKKHAEQVLLCDVCTFVTFSDSQLQQHISKKHKRRAFGFGKDDKFTCDYWNFVGKGFCEMESGHAANGNMKVPRHHVCALCFRNTGQFLAHPAASCTFFPLPEKLVRNSNQSVTRNESSMADMCCTRGQDTDSYKNVKAVSASKEFVPYEMEEGEIDKI